MKIELLKADIVLVWGSSWISKGIQTYELLDTGWKNLPSHAELVVDPENFQDISAEEKGVELVDFKRLLNKKTGVEVYRYKMNEIQREYVVNKALEWLGLPYDYGGFLYFLAKFIPFFRKFVHPEKFAFFCSELVDAAFEDEGIDFFEGKHPHETHPGNLWLLFNYSEKSKYFTKVFENNIPKIKKVI